MCNLAAGVAGGVLIDSMPGLIFYHLAKSGGHIGATSPVLQA